MNEKTGEQKGWRRKHYMSRNYISNSNWIKIQPCNTRLWNWKENHTRMPSSTSIYLIKILLQKVLYKTKKPNARYPRSIEHSGLHHNNSFLPTRAYSIKSVRLLQFDEALHQSHHHPPFPAETRKQYKQFIILQKTWVTVYTCGSKWMAVCVWGDTCKLCKCDRRERDLIRRLLCS